MPTSFRTLPRFRVVRARALDEAVAALASAERPAVLAGGTDLPARFNEGFAPSDLIDISRLDDMRRIEVRDDALIIGAAVTHADGSTDPLVARHLPGFADAWARIANVRVRLRATIGGNLMARRTRYEAANLLAALGANAHLATTAGAITLPVEELWSSPHLKCLLTAVSIPLRQGLRLDYDRTLRPIMTQAVAVDAAGLGRIVTSTEYVVPVVRTLPLAPQADDLIGDPVTSAAYLTRMRRVLLARQLQRLGAA